MSADAAASDEPKTAGLLRRLGAMLYDSLLITALLMVATATFLPLTGGEALTRDRLGPIGELLYQLALLTIVVGFFGWFWTRRGQTLGMVAWRLKVQRDDGAALTWADAIKRLAAACVSWLPLGLGYLWIWIDRDGLAWHDRWTGTRVVVMPRNQK